VFVVVAVVALLISVIANAPVIFLRLAELRRGEVDMLLENGGWTQFRYLNYSRLGALLDKATPDPDAVFMRGRIRTNEPPFSYHAPRWTMGVGVRRASACTAFRPSSRRLLPDTPAWAYVGCDELAGARDAGNCFPAVCGDGDWADGSLFAIDSDRERRAGIGRNWQLPTPQRGVVHMQQLLADDLGVVTGDLIFLRISLSRQAQQLWNTVFNTENALKRDSVPHLRSDAPPPPDANATTSVEYRAGMGLAYVPFRVGELFAASEGKWTLDEKTALVVDYGSLLDYVGGYLHPELPPVDRHNFKYLDLYQYAHQVVVSLPPPRTNVYLTSDFDALQKGATEWGSEVGYLVGYGRVWTPMPLLDELQDTQFVALGLGVILNVVILVLLFLSMLLIYSLLMINVDTRTFEMAVFRMLGQRRSGVVHLLLFQAMSYAIPAWILGLVAAQIGGYALAKFFGDYTHIEVPALLTPTSIIVATVLGVASPILASLLPIRAALQRSLHTSLDVRRQAAPAVRITIERSETGAISVPLLCAGVLLAGFGFGIYYVMPLSLLSFNLALLLNLFVLLLVGMLLGMVLLSLNVSYLLERAVLFVFFFWDSDAVVEVAIKNMGAHRPRNRKTAVLYSLSLAFIVFISTAYYTQIDAFVTQVEQEYASDYRLTATERADANEPFTLNGGVRYLDYALARHPAVKSFTYSTHSLRASSRWITSVRFGPVGNAETDTVGVYGVPPLYFAATDRRYFALRTAEANKLYGNEFYSVDGDRSVLIGARFVEDHGVGVGDAISFTMAMNATDHLARLKVLEFANIVPGFKLSPFRVGDQDALVGFPTFMRMLRTALPDSIAYQSLEDVPLRRALVYLHENVTKPERDEVRSLLAAGAARAGGGVRIESIADELSPVETVNTIMSYFFNITTVVAMAVAFFSLISSMYANVREQTKEIGVLRAIGLSKPRLYRVYMYEAFTLVFSSSVMGMIIGSFVGYTMVIQQALFTQRPLEFHFSGYLLLGVFLSSILGALVASLGPVRNVLGRSVVSVMRIAE
jgi:ABC-type lipoprotein release transport system permease subunit